MTLTSYSNICERFAYLKTDSTKEPSTRCFYLDSPDNARRNGMPLRGKHENETNKRSVSVEWDNNNDHS